MSWTMEMQEDPNIVVSAKIKSQIKALWKKGHNVWKISQLTGQSERVVSDVVNDGI